MLRRGWRGQQGRRPGPCLAAALACLAAGLALAPPASAVPMHAELDVAGPAAFDGAANGTFAWAGSVHDARLGHAGPVPAFHVEGTARLERHRFVTASTNESSPAGPRSGFVPGGGESEDLGAVSGLLSFGPNDGHASVRLVPSDGARLPLGGPFALGSPIDLYDGLRRQGDASQGSPAADTYPPFGARLHGADAQPPPAGGRVVVTGYALAVGGREVDTRWTAQGSALDATGEAYWFETRQLVIDGRFTAPALPEGEWATVVSGLDGTLSGRLTLRSSGGALQAGNATGPADVPLFEAEGDFAVHAAYRRPGSLWRMDGDGVFVSANDAVLADGRGPGPAAVAAGVGALAVLLAVLAKLAGWPVLPGLNVADPLRNGRRLELLRLVAANPGINQMEIAGRLDASRATVRHHLRILLRADLVAERRRGAACTYTLNDQSYGFPAPGATPSSAAEAMSWMRHPARGQILDALRALGEADYRAMQGHWAATGREPLPRATVSYHCGLMEEQGLVARRRDGKRVLWSLAFRRDEAVRQHRKAFLARARLGAASAALAEGPADLREVRERLRRAGVRCSLADVDRKLRLLEATGYARRVGDRFEAVAGAGA